MHGVASSLDAVLVPPSAQEFGSLTEFRAALDARLGKDAPPLSRALVGGALADRLGYAFAAGYQAALIRLAPDLAGVRASLCASEAGGAHPRAIQTALERRPDGLRVCGQKRFSTLADAADVLLVIASEGRSPDGRNRLRLVRVGARAPGVTIEPLPALPFAPEISHGIVTLDVAVREADVVAGDAYTTVLKPFRTLEDVAVLTALLAHLGASARRERWPEPLVERILAALLCASALWQQDPGAAATHLALAGLLALARELAEAARAHLADPERRARFDRDAPLLAVAGNAREQRRLAAWRLLGAHAAVPIP